LTPPTRGFSARFRRFQGFINQSLAASCLPLPRHTKAQSWHTQSELVTYVAKHFRIAEGLDLRSLRLDLTCDVWERQVVGLPGAQEQFLRDFDSESGLAPTDGNRGLEGSRSDFQ